MSLSLRLLGGASVSSAEGPVKGPLAHRHRLALLAILAGSHPRPVGRDKLMSLLWPARDAENARVLLNQSVHVIRRAAGENAIVSVGDELRLDPSVIASDIVAFDEAIAAGQGENAVALYAGPFLDGFFLDESVEFERWVDRQRARLAATQASTLEGLALAAGRAADPKAEVHWWRKRAELDPLDSSVARRLMDAMERTGNRAGAVQHGLAHQDLLARELEIEPDPAIGALIERLRRETVGAVTEPVVRPFESTPAATAIAPRVLPQVPARSTRRRTWIGLAVAVGAGVALVRFTGPPRTTVAPTPAVVDEIAQAVARELARRDSGAPGPVPREQRTPAIAAYDALLRGNDPVLLRSDSGARRARSYFERAVELDSNYAAAWAGLARLANRTAGNSADERLRGIVLSEMAARKAIALDDSLADAHATLAVTFMDRGDLPRAESSFLRAIELEPRGARYREALVRLYVWWERPDDALVQAREAVAISALSPTANAELARALLALGKDQEALAQLDRVRQLEPPLLRAASIAAQCLDGEDRVQEAIDAMRPSAEAGQLLSVGLYGYLLGRAGQVDSARRLMASLERANQNALNIGLVHEGLGDFDAAMRWFDRAVDDWSLRPGSELGPTVKRMFAAHRTDPRVKRLRTRLGLRA